MGGRRWARWIAAAVVAASAGAVPIGVAPSVASPAPDTGGDAGWRPIGDDAVYRPPAGKRAFQLGPLTGAGFAVYDGDARLAGPTTIRLAQSPDIEAFRDAAEVAAGELTAITGIDVQVAAGILPTRTEPLPGEVLVIVSDTSPCSGDWAGCGGPTYGTTTPALITGGKVWLRPDTAAYGVAEMQHLVSHELGHAFSLDHYGGPYRGELQVMHPFQYDAASYRTGDIAGLRLVAGLPPEDLPLYNDDFATPEEMAGDGGTATGTTADATRETGEPEQVPGAGPSVWYRFLPAVDGTVTISTAGDGFDTFLAAYTGDSVTDLDAVTADSADPGTEVSTISFPVTAFTTYRVALGGVGVDVAGPFVLTWGLTPANDDFADATDLVGGSQPGLALGSVRGATSEPGEPVHHEGVGTNSIWYRITPTVDAVLDVTTRDSQFDTVLAVYGGSELDELEKLGSNDDEVGAPDGRVTSRVTVPVEAGRSYAIAVAGFGGGAGDVLLGYTLVPTGTWARPLDLACPTGGLVPPPPFEDVTGEGLHDRAIGCVFFYGIAQGRTATTFAPGGPVTRAQMASFVARLVDTSYTPLPDAETDAFADDDESVHEDNINRLAAAGVVTGRGDGRYAPDEPVTRAQMATFLVRAYELISAQTLDPAVSDHFVDDDEDTHEANIDLAAQLGLTGGVAEGVYEPGAALRRDQMASFLARTVALLVDTGWASYPFPGEGEGEG